MEQLDDSMQQFIIIRWFFRIIFCRKHSSEHMISVSNRNVSNYSNSFINVGTLASFRLNLINNELKNTETITTDKAYNRNHSQNTQRTRKSLIWYVICNASNRSSEISNQNLSKPLQHKKFELLNAIKAWIIYVSGLFIGKAL